MSNRLGLRPREAILGVADGTQTRLRRVGNLIYPVTDDAVTAAVLTVGLRPPRSFLGPHLRQESSHFSD
jgi:hypothetical protein